MYKLKYWLRNSFGFSQKETNGFIILSALMVLLLFVPPIFAFIIDRQENTEIQDRKKLDSLIACFELANNSFSKDFTFQQKEKYSKTSEEYFLFNPNSATLEEFMKLGLHRFMAERIVKFRTKGGKFKVKSDLKKIYGFPLTLYEKLEPYIDLPDQTNFQSQKTNLYQASKIRKPFDINRADTTALIELKGIGSKLAVRIIKYRDKLGGFINVDQYQEVFGLDSLALQELQQYAFITKDFVPVKININTADQHALFAHPYIGKKFAKVIFNYRQAHGSFVSLEDLLQIKIIDPVAHKKMKNYLTLE